MQKSLNTPPVLVHFDPEKPTIVETDASNYVCSGILSQLQKDSTWRPVAYRSQTMSKAECNYDIHDKELLAIMQALKEWRQYYEGSKFTVKILTDHKSLVPFTTTKTLNGRQIRWNEELANFDINIKYRPGLEGGKPDALTRRSDDMPTQKDTRKTQRDITLLRREKYWRKLIQLRAIETQIQDGMKVKLKIASEENYQFQEIRNALEKEQTKLGKIALGLTQWKKDLMWYKNRIWVPHNEEIRTEIIRQHHDIPQAGHGGIVKTTQLICRIYYWPELRKDIKRYVKNYDTCQRIKPNRHATYRQLQPREVPVK